MFSETFPPFQQVFALTSEFHGRLVFINLQIYVGGAGQTLQEAKASALAGGCKQRGLRCPFPGHPLSFCCTVLSCWSGVPDKKK